MKLGRGEIKRITYITDKKKKVKILDSSVDYD